MQPLLCVFFRSLKDAAAQGLTRYGGDLYDLDPLYNNTCTSGRDACAEGCECCCAQSNSSCDYAAHGLGLAGSFNLTTCVGANTHDHLDYGVTSFLYDGAFARGSRPTILAEMFPVRHGRLQNASSLAAFSNRRPLRSRSLRSGSGGGSSSVGSAS